MYKKNILIFLLYSFLLLLNSILVFSNPIDNKYKSEPGPYKVLTKYYNWFDQKRNREIPVKIYYHDINTEKIPLIIFSHGLGGSREAGKQWGEHWASHGYVSVHLQHHGSDSEMLKNLKGNRKEKLNRFSSEANLKNAIERTVDIKFAIDQITILNNKDSLFKGLVDLDHIGMSGHSFGANTTLMVSGQKFILANGREFSFDDKRIKASIAFSPPANAKVSEEKIYAAIKIPFFTMTGTEDISLINDTKAIDRRIPYDNMKGPDKYIVTFEGGDHMVFSGQPRLRGVNKNDEIIHDFIRMSTIAFWDSYLKNIPEAKRWLLEDFEKLLISKGIFEKKQF